MAAASSTGPRRCGGLACDAVRGALALLAALTAGCGGAGGDSSGSTPPVVATAPPPATSPVSIDYPQSLLPGLDGSQEVSYTAAVSSAAQATVHAAAASALLNAGTTAVLAEHVDTALPGLRVICISGNGQSTNVVTGINLGVIAESAAILLDARWSAIDPVAAWSVAVSTGGTLVGWENCGVKAEGLPSPSSRLMPLADGGYREDVYDGNPGTNFNTIARVVTTTTVASMLSSAGFLTTEDPTRPLRLTFRAYADPSGDTIFVEAGVPAPGASASTKGFIALYTRTGG